ncbi:hypothetical protein QTP88_027814 [Uroleucon formosanum]
MNTCGIQQIKLGSNIVVDGLFFNETNNKLNNTDNEVILSDSYSDQKYIPTDIHKKFEKDNYNIEPLSNNVNSINTDLNHDLGLEMYNNDKCIETTDIIDIKYENNIESSENDSRIPMSASNMLSYQPYM